MSDGLRQREKQEWREQYGVLRQIEDGLEMPMFILSLAWAGLLVLELAWGMHRWLEWSITTIWIVFIAEFLLKFIIAPKRLTFLRKNWLGLFALLIPALRVFRVARVLRILRYGRAIRGLTLARVLTTFNRGLRTLRRNMLRFGFGYILGLTFLVAMLGAAGMYTFERQAEGGIETFGDALWFTAMLLTTSGSDYWPQTPEGRILCFLIALYAFAVFGYVTATLATLLVGQEQKSRQVLNVEAQTISALRAEIKALSQRLDRDFPGGGTG